MRIVMAVSAVFCLLAVGKAAEDADAVRVWHDVSGKQEVRAALVESKYSKDAKDVLVTLKKEDGTTVSVPFKKLSEEDQLFVKRAAQAKQPKKPQPKDDAQPAAKSDKTAAPKKTKPSPAAKKGVEAAEAKIEKALAENTALEFMETPLDDVINFLKDKHKIEIQLDKKSLDDAGVKSNTPITKQLKDVPLKSALKLILREIDLTHTIHEGVLLITTPERAESLLITRVYPVTDLVVGRDRFGRVVVDTDTIVDQITSTVVPASWDVVGGPGSVAATTAGNTVILTVSQTREVHEQIQNLLAKVRKLANPGKR